MGHNHVYVLMYLWVLCIELASCQPSDNLHLGGKHHKSQSSVLFSFYLTYRNFFCLKLCHSVPEVTAAAVFIKTNG